MSGPSTTISSPCFASRSRSSGERAAAAIAPCSLSTTARGVPAGAKTPNQAEATTSMPASFSVGTSGKLPERALPVVASARSLPAFTCASTIGMWFCDRSTSPASSAVTACPPPG